MGRHVVGALGVMHVAAIPGREAIERRRQIEPHVRIGVFLDQQGRGCVAAMDRQHALKDAACKHPAGSSVRDFRKAGSRWCR